MRRIYIFANGIRVSAETSLTTWNHRAAIWVNLHTPFKAVPFSYHTKALLRWIRQGRRAEELCRMLELCRAGGFEIHLAGHSNGCDLILRALETFSGRIESIHLFEAAAEADCSMNGLNARISKGQLGALHCYCSRGDEALMIARISRVLAWPLQPLRALGYRLGYGSLGLEGPQGLLAPDLLEANGCKAEVVFRDSFDHSTWFENGHFEPTLKAITAA